MLFAAAPPPRELVDWRDFLPDLVAVAIYLLVTAGIIVWSARRQADTEDFFLGGRRMPWLAVGMSLLATLLSSISYLAVPGEMIKNGVAMFAGYLAVPFSMVVVLFLWVPFFMRLRLTSAYEYLERRFNYSTRLLASVLFLLLRLGWISMVMYTASLALSAMTRSLVPVGMVDPLVAAVPGAGAAPLWRDTLAFWIVAVVGLASTVYACLGGIRAVIWNDVLQFVMLFGGTIVTLFYVVWATGAGPVEWWTTVAENTTHTRPQVFSFDLSVRTTIVTAIIYNFSWAICTHSADQVVLQRYFSTTSLSAARRSYIVHEIANFSIGVLLAMSGLALLYFYLQNPSFLPEGATPQNLGDKTMPHFFAHQLWAGMGGLILAGFLCDAMQTLVSGVNSITAVATSDVLEHKDRPEKSLPSGLRLARLLTVAFGITATAVAFFVTSLAQGSGRNIYDLMPRSFNLFLGPLATLFLIGMFLPRATGRSAFPAALCALLIAFVWSYWAEVGILLNKALGPAAGQWWTDILGVNTVKDAAGQVTQVPKIPTFTMAILAPYGGGFLVAALLSLFVERRREHPGRAYTWFAVMRRPEIAASDATPR